MIEELKFQQLEAAFRYMTENKQEKGVDTYEFGVYNGNSIRKLLVLQEKYKVSFGWLHGFDSFEGLPENNDDFSKFAAGAYKSKYTCDELNDEFNKYDIRIHQCWFKNIVFNELLMYPAKLIHIDCDLYNSTVDALDFMFKNKLVVPGTLIAYDEFIVGDKSTNGEWLAHMEIMNKYKCQDEEVWHYTYRDKDLGTKIRQSLFEVISV